MIQNNKYTENKEMMIIPEAVHTDLYDNLDVIPFDKTDDFFSIICNGKVIKMNKRLVVFHPLINSTF